MTFINRMAGQDYISKFREYLDYIEEHLNNVNKAFEEVSWACAAMPMIGDDHNWHTLRQEVRNHDLSKFGVEEFCAYRNSFYPINKEKILIRKHLPQRGSTTRSSTITTMRLLSIT